MENKYYTPDIKDIKLGDYYEVYIDDNWEKLELIKESGHIIIDFDFWKKGIENKEIRVPYLTKEQIEAEGWEMYAKSVDTWFKFKESPIMHTKIQDYYGYKPYSLYLNYGFHDNKLQIRCDFSGGKDFSGSHTLFEGFCPSINEFRYICKLLNIK